MRKTILTGALFFILLSSLSLADWSCINSTAAQFSTTLTVNGNPVAVSYPEYCQFNCSAAADKCNPSPYDVSIADVAILVALPLIAFVFIYLSQNSTFAVKFNDFEFDPLQLLFLALGLWMIITDSGLFLHFTQNANQTGAYGILLGNYQAVQYGYAVIILLLVVYFMINVFRTSLHLYRSRKR